MKTQSETAKEYRENQAHKLRAHLLSGKRIHRMIVPSDVGLLNCSLHSIVSILRNEMFFPVTSVRERGNGGIVTYVTPQREINYFYKSRKSQIARMRRRVREARIERGVAGVERMAQLFDEPVKLSVKAATTLQTAALQILSKT